ncbi:hypothetical protein OH76DRAFT_1408853 [Lentinus brumalis]|uniref:Protein kinase domain-containing protein n=1 Tax=Lentinus brumalis TaxID=2498619 RepID=A0A371CWH4_9APHY|nr:hypothetical protein OH76DRAFT_1408853 [Polyporus brumalis]
MRRGHCAPRLIHEPTNDEMSEDGLGPLAPPDWLREHSDLGSRGIKLSTPLKPFCVWRTYSNRWTPPYAVKIVPSDSEEADIYERLHRLDPTSPNHTLPCDVIHAKQAFLIMPCLDTILYHPVCRGRGLLPLLAFFRQVMEGIEFLHERNIAHMDMYHGQVVVASERHVAFHKEVQAGKAYIIDFDRSKCLKSGPGIQHAIDYCKPPLGMTQFDPYSWDVYCTGILFDTVTKDIYSERHIPWVVRRYIKWLVGNERGCARICSCRPSARRARQMLGVIHWAACVWERAAVCLS